MINIVNETINYPLNSQKMLILLNFKNEGGIMGFAESKIVINNKG